MSVRVYDEGYDWRGLNIGCGNSHLEGYLNSDIGNCRKDMFLDVNQPLPFPDQCFDVITANHVMEHINKDSFWSIFKELHRVLKVEGIFEFCVPEAGSDNFWTDPTHTMPFTVRTMDFLIDGKALRDNGVVYGADFSFLELEPPKVDNLRTIYFRLSK